MRAMTFVDGEYWYRCQDCDGTKRVNVPDGDDDGITVLRECPGCGGIGVIEGDAGDEAHGWVRVPDGCS